MLIHTGKVKDNVTAGLYVRSTPAGATITKLDAGTAVIGKGELVFANGYYRMEIASPVAGWVASEYLEYTSRESSDEVEPSQKIYVSYERGGTQYEYDLVEG